MRIAVTGGIAEGKSTVLGYLAELGYSTASSDGFARECFYEPSIQERLSRVLGMPFPVSPATLRETLATSSHVRRAVNRIMHPCVISKIQESDADFVEVPLLIETCSQSLFDGVWVVTCGPQEQLRRLELRSADRSYMDLLGSQLSSQTKTPFSDVIVRTNADRETVKWFVRNASISAFNLDCAD